MKASIFAQEWLIKLLIGIFGKSSKSGCEKWCKLYFYRILIFQSLPDPFLINSGISASISLLKKGMEPCLCLHWKELVKWVWKSGLLRMERN